MRQSTIIFFAVISILMIILSSNLIVVRSRGWLVNKLMPQSKSIYSLGNRTSSIYTTFKQIKDLANENSELVKENQTLKSQLTEMEEIKFKISLLEKELGAKAINLDRKITPVAVVGRAPSSFREIISLDKGSKDGIKIGQPVLSNGFLIGKITNVYDDSSQAELITSHRFLAPVVLEKTRSLGLLKGGINGLQVEQLPVDVKIEIGENVISSGLAGQLPPGIPIGTVKSIISKPSDIFRSVLLNSPINLNTLEYVVILL